MAQSGWLWGHIAGIPGNGLTPVNHSYTDKPFRPSLFPNKILTLTPISKSQQGSNKILRLTNK
jgi:hypothetical protein